MNITNELKELGWSDDLIAAAEAMTNFMGDQVASAVTNCIESPGQRPVVQATQSFMLKSGFPTSASSLHICK